MTRVASGVEGEDMRVASATAPAPRFRLIREEFWLVVVPLAALLVGLGVVQLVLDVRLARAVPEGGSLVSNVWLSSARLLVELAVIAFFLRRAWTRHLAGAKRGSA